jgi:pimeloyl-ACP methyl ester carboxylesterase
MPALIVKIAKSPLLDREVARKMVAQLAHGQLAEVDDSYHHVMLDNPAALIDVIRDFILRLK